MASLSFWLSVSISDRGAMVHTRQLTHHRSDPEPYPPSAPSPPASFSLVSHMRQCSGPLDALTTPTPSPPTPTCLPVSSDGRGPLGLAASSFSANLKLSLSTLSPH